MAMDWDDLRYFLAVARLGTVRAAGDQLAVAHTTVARRVEALEERLATRLFDHHRDGYVLTEAGRRLMPAAEAVESGVHALTRELAGRDARLEGPVHVTCGDDYVAAQIVADLAPWCRVNPGVELQVSTDGRAYDLARGEADLAVRALLVGSSPPAYVVGHRLAPIRVAPYVGLDHAARLTPPQPDARWLGYPDMRVMAEMVRAQPWSGLPVWGAFNGLAPMVAAVSEGLGLALLPVYVGDVEPALVRVAGGVVRHAAELWMLHHPDLRETARVQAVRHLIRQGFSRRTELFGSWCDAAPQVRGVAPPRQ